MDPADVCDSKVSRRIALNNTSPGYDAKDFAIVRVAFVLLVAARWSPLGVVAWCVVASVLRTLWG